MFVADHGHAPSFRRSSSSGTDPDGGRQDRRRWRELTSKGLLEIAALVVDGGAWVDITEPAGGPPLARATF